jgi:hypothetical protein
MDWAKYDRELEQMGVIHKCGSPENCVECLKAKIKQLEAENDRLGDILYSIKNWCKAYPKDVFIGKEFDLANHVLEGIQKLITDKALEK